MATNVTTQWNHAVPLDHNNHRPRAESASRGANYTYQESSNYAYGSVSKRPSNTNMRGDNEGQRSRNNSIPRKRSAKPLRQQQVPAEEPDEGWIHRDKLREIEIQEMEQAGMRIRQPRRSGSTGPGASQRSTSRSMSRSGLRRPASREQMGESPVEEPGYGEFKRKRVSMIPAADASEEREAEFHHQNDSELRTLEELAAPQPGYRQHSGRPSTSRIPISKISPVPVPNAMVDRDSPLPRSRHGSTNWSGNWDDMQYAGRARSGSMGSQVLLDDDGYRTPSRPVSSHIRADDRNGAGPYSHSPQKARVPNKDAPISGGRKTSGPRPPTANANKPRVRSGASGMMIRPPSSSGPRNPINRPEGDAPWLASMYKPDPRLPPEEQMLPTHAKRLAQEEGIDVKTVDINDGAYAPVLNTQQHTLEQPSSEKQQHLSPTAGSPTKSTHTLDAPAWPLGGETTNEPTSPRPGTSGGYRITPVITSRPSVQKNSTSEKDITTPHNPTPRVPDFDKDEDELPKKKKGCMGCVVM